jgi:hypothetical protein
MATAAAPQLRQRISFRNNQTQTVTLEAPGVEQNGINGPEYRYRVEGNAIMWVPPEVHQAIEQARAGWPAEFEITKTPKGWLTVHIANEPPAPQPAPQPAPTATREPRPGALTGNPQQQSTAHQPGEEPYTATMHSALCAAIRCAAAAEDYARSIGRALAFETGDVRAIAATLFIHATQGSR